MNILSAVCFLAFVATGLAVTAGQRWTSETTRRSLTNLFIGIILFISFASGLSQRDMWPFSSWAMMVGLTPPAARSLPTLRIVGVDANGNEHEIDYRAWNPLSLVRSWLLYFSQEDQVRVFHTLGRWLAERPLLCQMIGVGTLIFELGFITVLFSKTARRLLVPLAAVFHLGILLSMNLAFLNVPQLLVFVDWDVVATWLRRKSTYLSGAAVEGAQF